MVSPAATLFSNLPFVLLVKKVTPSVVTPLTVGTCVAKLLTIKQTFVGF